MKKVNAAYFAKVNPNEQFYSDDPDEREEIEFCYLLSKAIELINPLLTIWNSQYERSIGCKLFRGIPVLKRIHYDCYIYKKSKEFIDFLNRSITGTVKLDVDRLNLNIIGRSDATKRIFYVKFD